MHLTSRQFAVGLAVLVLAGGAGAAYGVTRAVKGLSGERQAFLNDAAQRLGVQPSKLDSALKDAATARIDAAVKRGDLTKQQADAIKRGIRSGRFGGFGASGMPGGGATPFAGPNLPGPAAGFFGEVAKYLDLTGEQLWDKLRNGQSLAEIAKAQGKSVEGLKETILDAVKKQLDKRVDDGVLTRAQADSILSQLRSHLDEIVNQAGFPKPPAGAFGGPGGGAGGSSGQQWGPPSGALPSGAPSFNGPPMMGSFAAA